MKKIIYVIGMLCVLVSCNKSKEGFVELKEINQFGVGLPEDTSFTVFQLDTLHVDPRVIGFEEPNARYEHEWILYPIDSKSVLLSNKRILNEPVGAKPGNYYIQYTIHDTHSGVRSINRYNISIKGAFYQGWVISNNVGNNGRLSFIRADDELYLNVLEDVNHRSYPGKVISIFPAVYGGGFFGSYNQVLYFTENGVARFDSDSFAQTSDFNEDLYAKISFHNRVGYGMNSYFFDQFMINEGDLYMRAGPAYGGEADMGGWSGRTIGEYSMFPYVFMGIGGANEAIGFFYDNLHKKFYFAPYSTRNIYESRSSNDNFDFANIGKTMMATDYTLGNNFLSVMKDDVDYWMYTLNLNTNVQNGNFYKISNSPNISQLSAFAASSRYQHAYYVANHNIYKIDVLSNKTTLLYTLPADLDIVDMKMFKHTLRMVQTAPNEPDHNKMLVVAGNKGESGEVLYIYLDDLGNHDATRATKKFEGFGKITQIEYRNPN